MGWLLRGEFALILILMAAQARVARAETLHLKNGDVLKGQIIAINGDVLQVSTAYGALNVLKDSILTIDFSADGRAFTPAPAAPPAPAQPVFYPQVPVQAPVSEPVAKKEINKWAGTTVKFGLDTGGSSSISASIGSYNLGMETDVDSGFSMGFENTSSITSTPLLAGVGLNLQTPRGFEDSDVTFQFFSAYGLLKVPVIQGYAPVVMPYLVAHVGVGTGMLHNVDDSYDASLKGGLYYAFGAEFDTKELGATLLYAVNKGTLDIENVSFDVKYERLSVFLNYKF